MTSLEMLAITRAAEQYGVEEDSTDFFDVIEEVCERRMKLILVAVVAIAGDDAWKKIEEAVRKAEGIA